MILWLILRRTESKLSVRLRRQTKRHSDVERDSIATRSSEFNPSLYISNSNFSFPFPSFPLLSSHFPSSLILWLIYSWASLRVWLERKWNKRFSRARIESSTTTTTLVTRSYEYISWFATHSSSWLLEPKVLFIRLDAHRDVHIHYYTLTSLQQTSSQSLINDPCRFISHLKLKSLAS